VVLGELGAGLVADAEDDGDFDPDAVGVVLVGVASCVGVGDVRLGVGCADRVAVVCGAVPRLVPGEVLPACVARTEAVAGGPSFAGAAGEDWPVIDMWPPPELSNMATIAATPQSATPIPAAARRRRRNGEPTLRSEY